MRSIRRCHSSIFRASLRPQSATLGILLMLLFFMLGLLLIMLTAERAHAQTFKVIYNFTGGADGADPLAGLSMDKAGNLYGTAYSGGGSELECDQGCGTAFRLRRQSSGWVFTLLYGFSGGDYGSGPSSRLSVAEDSTLYGNLWTGGGGCSGCASGMVFHLAPSPTAPKSLPAPWEETAVYRFAGGSDGWGPEGDLTFDQSGNIYGTTEFGGSTDSGTIYELKQLDGNWTEEVLFSPQTYEEGTVPEGGVVFDRSGNLYGIFRQGGLLNEGAVYKLSPSESGWTRADLSITLPMEMMARSQSED